jgi:DNA polymerase I
MRDDAWNWSGPKQVKEAFKTVGVVLDSTGDDTLATVDHPLAQLLRDYRSTTKLASTYGPDWYAKALHGDRIQTS